MYYCPLWFNATSSSVKKLKCSYNCVLRRLLCIRMLYSASAMFVTHGIPSFYELLRKCIYCFLNVLVLAETLSLRHACRITHKTLVAISIILNSSQFYFISMKCIIYY